MPVYRNKYKYQLIHPIVGTRLYQTTSLKKGAQKCYDELKSFNNINARQFSIINADTYETYQFQIDNFSHSTQSGGNNNKQTTDKDIQSTIALFDNRLKKLEEVVYNKYPDSSLERNKPANKDKIADVLGTPKSNKDNKDNKDKEDSTNAEEGGIVIKTKNNKKTQDENIKDHTDGIMAQAVSKNIHSIALMNRREIPVQNIDSVKDENNCVIM